MRDSALESSVYKLSKYERFKSVFNHIIKFISNFLFMFFVVIILVILVYGLYTKKNGNNGYVPIVSAYVIVSPSMVPTINVYDAVVAYRPNVDTLKKGDIITFNSTDARYVGRTVTHRILGVTNIDGQVAFRTKGDNNTTLDDAHVLGGNIYGKVFFVIPWLGYLQILLTKPYGWILLVVLPCTFIIISDILKLSKTIKKGRVATNRNFKNVEIMEEPSYVQGANKNVEVSKGYDASLTLNNSFKEKKIVQDISLELPKMDVVKKDDAPIFLNKNRHDCTIFVASHYERAGITCLQDSVLEQSCSSPSCSIIIVANYLRDKRLCNLGMGEYERKIEDQNKGEKEEKEIDSFIEIL